MLLCQSRPQPPPGNQGILDLLCRPTPKRDLPRILSWSATAQTPRQRHRPQARVSPPPEAQRDPMGDRFHNPGQCPGRTWLTRRPISPGNQGLRQNAPRAEALRHVQGATSVWIQRSGPGTGRAGTGWAGRSAGPSAQARCQGPGSRRFDNRHRDRARTRAPPRDWVACCPWFRPSLAVSLAGPCWRGEQASLLRLHYVRYPKLILTTSKRQAENSEKSCGGGQATAGYGQESGGRAKLCSAKDRVELRFFGGGIRAIAGTAFGGILGGVCGGVGDARRESVGAPAAGDEATGGPCG